MIYVVHVENWLYFTIVVVDCEWWAAKINLVFIRWWHIGISINELIIPCSLCMCLVFVSSVFVVWLEFSTNRKISTEKVSKIELLCLKKKNQTELGHQSSMCNFSICLTIKQMSKRYCKCGIYWSSVDSYERLWFRCVAMLTQQEDEKRMAMRTQPTIHTLKFDTIRLVSLRFCGMQIIYHRWKLCLS